MSATFTEEALDGFQTGVGRPATVLGPTSTIQIKRCRLILAPSSSLEKSLFLLVEEFSWLMGHGNHETEASRNVENIPEIQTLKQQLFDFASSVDSESEHECWASASGNLVSQALHPTSIRSSTDQSMQSKRYTDLEPDQAILRAEGERHNPSTIEKERARQEASQQILVKELSAFQHEQAQASGRQTSSKTFNVQGKRRINGEDRRWDLGRFDVPKDQRNTLHQEICKSKPVGCSLECPNNGLVAWQHPNVERKDNTCLLPSGVLKEIRDKLARNQSSIVTSIKPDAPSKKPSTVLQTIQQSQIQVLPSPSQGDGGNQQSSQMSTDDSATERSSDILSWSGSESAGRRSPIKSEDEYNHRPPDSSDPAAPIEHSISAKQARPRPSSPDAESTSIEKKTKFTESNAETEPHLSDGPQKVSDYSSSSPSGLDESVPFVLGDERVHAASSQPQSVHSNRGTTSTNMRQRMRLRQNSHLDGASLTRLENVPSTTGPSRPGRLVSKVKTKDLIPSSPPTSSKLKQELGQAQKSRGRSENVTKQIKKSDLGFTSQDVGAEDPVITARRERSNFFKDRARQQRRHEEGEGDHKHESSRLPPSYPNLKQEPQHSPSIVHPSPFLDGLPSPPIGGSSRESSPANVRGASSLEQTHRSPDNLGDRAEPPAKRQRFNHARQQPGPAQPSPSVASSHSFTSHQRTSNPPADPFIAFVEAYSDYSEGRRHFTQMCREIGSLGKSLHRSLWDDYVVRHSTDYNDSSGLSYIDFYNEHIDEPLYTKRILNPTSLKLILEPPRNIQPSRTSEAPIHDVTLQQARQSLQVLQTRSTSSPSFQQTTTNPSSFHSSNSYTLPTHRSPPRDSEAYSRLSESFPFRQIHHIHPTNSPESHQPHQPTDRNPNPTTPTSRHHIDATSAPVSTKTSTRKSGSAIVGFGRLSSASKHRSSPNLPLALKQPPSSSSKNRAAPTSSTGNPLSNPTTSTNPASSKPSASTTTNFNSSVTLDKGPVVQVAETPWQSSVTADRPLASTSNLSQPRNVRDTANDESGVKRETRFTEFEDSFRRLKVLGGALGRLPAREGNAFARGESSVRPPRERRNEVDVLAWDSYL